MAIAMADIAAGLTDASAARGKRGRPHIALPVQVLATDAARTVLVETPHLEKALTVVRAWGFTGRECSAARATCQHAHQRRV
jgi:hypothetical protein